MLTGILNKTVLCDGLGMVISNSSANFVERLIYWLAFSMHVQSTSIRSYTSLMNKSFIVSLDSCG